MLPGWCELVISTWSPVKCVIYTSAVNLCRAYDVAFHRCVTLLPNSAPKPRWAASDLVDGVYLFFCSRSIHNHVIMLQLN